MKVGDYIRFKESGKIYRVKSTDAIRPILVRPAIAYRPLTLFPEDDIEIVDEHAYITVWEVNNQLYLSKQEALKYGNPIERKVYD